MTEKPAWGLATLALLVPWAWIGALIFDAYRPWQEHDAAATNLLLIWMPLAGIAVSSTWAIYGVRRSGLRRPWRWAVPAVAALTCGQLALGLWLFGARVAPT